MKRGRAGFAQKCESARADDRRKSGRNTHAAVADCVGVLDSGIHPLLRFLAPFSKDRDETLRFTDNLRRFHRNRGELFVLKITAARTKIGAGVAQNVNQLQSHSATLPEIEHFHFASLREFRQVTKTQPRPKFAGAAGNEISVFVELGRGFERGDSVWIWKT